jgi:hypothetical protein
MATKLVISHQSGVGHLSAKGPFSVWRGVEGGGKGNILCYYPSILRAIGRFARAANFQGLCACARLLSTGDPHPPTCMSLPAGRYNYDLGKAGYFSQSKYRLDYVEKILEYGVSL